MFLLNEGLVWERTEKTDANHDLVRVTRSKKPNLAATAKPAGSGVVSALKGRAEKTSSGT